MQNIDALKQILDSPIKAAIIPHRKPDADALGSCLAMAHYLEKKGHQVKVIAPTDYPKFLFWMPGNEDVINYEEKENQQEAETFIKEADLIFCLDFSSLGRIDKLGKVIEDSQKPVVLIDHHEGKEDFAAFELWNIKAAATAELVYDFIIMMGDKHLLNVPIGECIYAGIMTDTGSFKFPSTSSKVHRIIADLKDLGINSTKIHHLVYDTYSLDRLRFLGYILYKKLVIQPEYRTAYFAITLDELKEFSSKTGDTEGLVNYALSVEGVIMAALFIEKKDHVKMSFRSVGDFSVADMAKDHFGGGGHKNAAGGMLRTTLDKVVGKFNEVLPDYYKSLNKKTENKS